MCEEFRINPQKILSNKKEYSKLIEECGEPYPELSLKENYSKTFATSAEEYRINKNILGLYNDSDRPKNYYPSYFLNNFKSYYNPDSKSIKQNKIVKKTKSLVDLNLIKEPKIIDSDSWIAPKESTNVYPSTDPVKYHPSTQIPEKREADGFFTSLTKYIWGSPEEPLDKILQFSKPKQSDIEILFNQTPYHLFERRRKSLLLRQELKLSKNQIDVCLNNIELNNFRFDRVKTADSPYITEIHTMINDAMNRSFIPNGRYSSGSVICQDFIIHIQEKIDGYLIDKLPNMSQLEKNVMLCQLLLTLAVLQGQYGVLHNKINSDNIAFINIKKSKDYFKYKIAGRTFYLPNIGFLAVFIGFENARVLNPMYGIDHYRGIRNFCVSADIEPFWGNKAGNELTVELIKTKYIPILDENYKYKTYSQNNTNENVFVDGFDSVPDKTIDLSDMRTYPAFDFKKDIEDLVKIFIVKKYIFDGLKTILPDLTAAVLFPQFREIKFNIIEEFRWP